MSGSNGKRRPPRPQIEHLSGGATDTEAAAIAAALEQFLVDTAPPAAESAPPRSPWLQAALEEGISARQVEHLQRSRFNPGEMRRREWQ
jgi:hypothetical protein